MTPLKKVNREKRTGICGGAARAPTYTPPHSSRVVFSVHLTILLPKNNEVNWEIVH